MVSLTSQLARIFTPKQQHHRSEHHRLGQVLDNIDYYQPPRRENMALDGAALYVLDGDTAGAKVVQSLVDLGGRIVPAIQDATHAIIIHENSSHLLTAEMENAILTAQAHSIPIVNAPKWAEKCLQLEPDQHWSDIPIVHDLVPTIVQLLNNGADSSSTDHHHDHDSKSQFSLSLSQTFHYLKQEDPEAVEEDALKRAMELSMLDCALVIRPTTAMTVSGKQSSPQTPPEESPYKILGINADATGVQIKQAYCRLAKLTHPDKGGTKEAFHKVALAYRSLLSANNSTIIITDKFQDPKRLKSTAHWDKELADHRRLVEELFTSHGANLEQTAAAQEYVLEHALRLEPKSAGSTNLNERQELIYNSCFYLSLAASYLSGIGALLMMHDEVKKPSSSMASIPQHDTTSDFGEEDRFLIGETALQLKRLIEAAVVRAHPEWVAQGQVGEQVQAFSDFLVYLLDNPQAVVSEWAVVVFDTTSGIADVYKGKHYDARPECHASNCITLRYLPGHYEPLLPVMPENRPTLQQVLDTLDANQIFYVITDGAA